MHIPFLSSWFSSSKTKAEGHNTTQETQTTPPDGRITSHSVTPGNGSLGHVEAIQAARPNGDLPQAQIKPEEILTNAGVDLSYEDRVQALGRELFTAMSKSQTPMLNIQGSSKDMMEATMDNDQLRMQLFRLTAAMPMIKDNKELCSLMREYLGHVDADGKIGKLLGVANIASHLTWLGGHHVVAGTMRSNVEGMAETFIVADNINTASTKLEALWDKGIANTVDLLGEAAVSEEEAKEYCRIYKELIKGLAEKTATWKSTGNPNNTVPRGQVAVKLSSLSSIADPVDFEGSVKLLKDRLRPILQTAKENNAFVWVDMEDHYFKDLTMTVFKEILMEDEFVNWQGVGIAIQGYLKDSEKDVDNLIAWAEERETPVSVRLVKGAYWDFEQARAEINGWDSPVFDNKHETDDNYEKVTRKLLDANKYINTSIASHNVRSVANALAYADNIGLEKDKLEFQFLYGMAGPLQEALVKKGHRVRVYAPYGELLPGMAYLVRRLLENTANVSFMKAASNNPPSDVQNKLLQHPLVAASEEPPAQGRKQKSFTNDPVVDFSKKENRDQMLQALERVKAKLGKKHYPVINGRKTSTSNWEKSINPANPNEVIGHVAFGDKAHVSQAVQVAKDAYEKNSTGWKYTDVEKRAAILQQTAQIMRERFFDLSALMVYETGKSWKEATADVNEAIDFHEYYAQQAIKQLSPKVNPDNPVGERNVTFYQGIGVAGVISPWNFPLAIMSGMTSAALVAGNTVVMKPAEQSSVIASEYMEILKEAGLPAGVCNYVPGEGETVGDALVKNPDVDTILFTGSKDVGLLINENVAKVTEGQTKVRKAYAEMGGKNAVIVDTSADQEEAVRGILASAFGYGGQKCSAASRVILVGDKEHCDRFVKRLAQAAQDIMVGPSHDPAYYYGAQIDKEAYDKIRQYVDIGKSEGELVTNNKPIEENPEGGYFIRPHIFDHVDPNTTIAQEEIFGPVLSVTRVKDFNEALKVANGTKYALTGGLYSRTPSHIKRVVNGEFEVGNLYINGKITGAIVNRQAFGGFKLSGTGFKAGGPHYLLQLVKEISTDETTLLNGAAHSLLASESL